MRDTMRPLRVLLAVAAVLVFLAGLQLFVFSLRTRKYFAWTVANPLTAAFLGANYWGACVIEALAARERRWADARIAVPPVFVFTALTLVVSLVYLGQFHLGPAFAVHTRAVTWGWLAIYVVVPVLMVVLVAVQLRVPGQDPPTVHPPPAWLVGLIGVHAVLFLGLAVVLLADPTRGARLWPWALTPLTARAIGAWLFGFGVAAALSLSSGTFAGSARPPGATSRSRCCRRSRWPASGIDGLVVAVGGRLCGGAGVDGRRRGGGDRRIDRKGSGGTLGSIGSQRPGRREPIGGDARLDRCECRRRRPAERGGDVP